MPDADAHVLGVLHAALSLALGVVEGASVAGGSTAASGAGSEAGVVMVVCLPLFGPCERARGFGRGWLPSKQATSSMSTSISAGLPPKNS
jgi:hypothetical protein